MKTVITKDEISKMEASEIIEKFTFNYESKFENVKVDYDGDKDEFLLLFEDFAITLRNGNVTFVPCPDDIEEKILNMSDDEVLSSCTDDDIEQIDKIIKNQIDKFKSGECIEY